MDTKKQRHETVRLDSLLVQPRPGMQCQGCGSPTGSLGQHRIGLPNAPAPGMFRACRRPDASLVWVYSVSAAQSAATVGDERGSCPGWDGGMKGVFADDSHLRGRHDWSVNCRRQRGQKFSKGMRVRWAIGFWTPCRRNEIWLAWLSVRENRE
jgi:hypothetical protein